MSQIFPQKMKINSEFIKDVLCRRKLTKPSSIAHYVRWTSLRSAAVGGVEAVEKPIFQAYF
jgi:hypothetical protein